MSKDYIITETGFFTPKLKVDFYTVEFKKKCEFYKSEDSQYYQIIFVEQGSFTFVCGEKTEILKSGDVFIAQPFENYYIIGGSNSETVFWNLVIMTFSSNFFEFENSDAFLRPFDERKKGELNSYKKDEFKISIFNSIISPMKRYSHNNMSIESFAFCIGMLITEIKIAFLKKRRINFSGDSNDYRLMVYDYIRRNYRKADISIEKIAKKFAVSKFYINQTTLKFYNMKYHKTIESMRMWEAKRLMSETSDLHEICKMCGYRDYSGFYRCYVKFFGVSPKKDLIHLKEKGVFLSHDNKR